MRIFLKLILSLFLIAIGSVGGFFAATKYRPQLEAMASQLVNAATSETPGRKIIYYKNPMGEPDISAAPKKDSMGMDYIPVYEDEISGQPGSLLPKSDKSTKTTDAEGGKKILYYRNPMGLPDTSPVPKLELHGDGLYRRL